jgi:hypothetical protein
MVPNSKRRIDPSPEALKARNQEWPYFDRSEAMSRQSTARSAGGETLAEIAKSYAVDVSMISRLS